MLLLLYVSFIIITLYWVSKMLLPEMAKPPLPRSIRPSKSSKTSQYDTSENRITKLETLLEEKNKNIGLLQSELKSFYVQARDFDKIKSVLEEEIQRLREQNRIFRSELGLPAVFKKENSLT